MIYNGILFASMISLLSSSSYDRQKYYNLATFASEVERYDAAVRYINFVFEKESHLSSDEEELFRKSYRKAFDDLRRQWSTIERTKFVDYREQKPMSFKAATIEQRALESKMQNLCSVLFDLLSLKLKNEFSNDSMERVRYLKMQADFARDILGFSSGEFRADVRNHAQFGYVEALKVAHRFLPRIHPLLLSTALNYAIFASNCGETQLAIHIIKRALDGVYQEVALLTPIEYSNSQKLIQVMEKNLELWTT